MTCPNPKCNSELKPETKFCAQCGTPCAAPLLNAEEARAAEHNASEEEAASNRTRQIGSKDLSFQAPATHVQRLSHQDGGASSSEVPPKPPAARAAEKAPRAPLSRTAPLISALLLVPIVVTVCTNLVMRRLSVSSTERPATQAQQQQAPEPRPTPAQPPEQPPSSPDGEIAVNRRGTSFEEGPAAPTPAAETVSPGEGEGTEMAYELEAKRQELANINRQLSDAKRELDETKRGLSNGNRELKETEKKVWALKQQLASVESRLAALKTEVAAKRNALLQFEASIRRSRRENRRLKEAVASRRREIRELDIQIARGEQRVRKLRGELVVMRKPDRRQRGATGE